MINKKPLIIKSIESDVEKFLKSGNKITKVEPEVRAMPEFVWYRDRFPKRKHIILRSLKWLTKNHTFTRT